MLRSTASKVMWVGRTTVFLAGLFMAALALSLAFQFALANPAQATHSVCETDPETGKPICVPGLHSAPDLTVNSTSVGFFEGQTATNSGTYDDTLDDDLDETVSFSASEGAVSKTGTESGSWSWSRSNVQNPGSRTVTITATDSTGRASSISFTLNVNNVAPSGTLTSPAGGAFLKGTVALAANMSDPGGVNRVEFLVSGVLVGTDTTVPYSISWNSATVPDGSRTVSARAVDHQGATFTSIRSVTVDNTTPDTTLSLTPANPTNQTTANFSWTGSDAISVAANLKYSHKLDSGEWSPFSTDTSVSLADLGEGSHTFSVKAMDQAGNVDDASPAEHTWTVDTQAPTGTTIKINRGTNYTNSATVNLTLSATEAGSGVASMRFRNENTTIWSPWESYATSKSWALSGGDGTKTVRVQYRDNAGNISTIAQDSIKLDTTAPRVRKVLPVAGAKDIAPGTNVSVFFSEAMRNASINTKTFKLYQKGSTTPIVAQVSYDAQKKKAILNPKANLKRGVTYKALVTTVVKDLAGNRMKTSKVWFFTTKK